MKVVEAGPVRSGSPVGPAPAWTALVFTLAVAVAAVAGAPYLAGWLERAAGTPRPTSAATARPTVTPIPTAPPVAALASAWVSQSAAPVIVAGAATTIVFKFRNAGAAEWRRGTPSEVRLGIVGAYDPSLAHRWPYPERPAIQSELVVAPGQIATFEFDVRGPRPGTYRLRVRPVVDGVAWLTDQGAFIDVEVR